MNKLDCKVGEIWLNTNNAEIKLAYIDDNIIVGAPINTFNKLCLTFVYDRRSGEIISGSIYSLVMRKPEVIKLPYRYYVPLFKDQVKYYLGTFVSSKDYSRITECHSDFVKWIEVIGDIEVET